MMQQNLALKKTRVRPDVVSESMTSDFIDFETENELFSIEIKGHRFWSYARYLVYQSLIGFSPDHSRTGAQKLGRLSKELLKYFRAYLTTPFKLKKTYDLIIIGASSRRNLIDGKLVNPYVYPIIKDLYKDHRILFIDDSELTPSFQDNYPVDTLYWRPYRFLDKIKAACVRYHRRESEAFSAIESQLSEWFKIDADILSLAKQDYSLALNEFSRYSKIFKKLKPKWVLFVDNGRRQALVDAAQRLKIPTIELQHSVISQLNIYCNYPKHCDHSNGVVADYLFTYGDYWNHRLRSPIKPVATGFPYMDYQLEELPQKKIQAEKAVIIVSGSYSKNEFVTIAMRLSELLPDYVIYYKLKPTDYKDWEKRYPKEFIEKPNIRVIDNDDRSLYEYLKSCAYQIGVNSGGLYEGLFFGLTSFILKTGYYDESRPLYENGHAFLVSSAEEIAAKINAGEKPKNLLDRDSLFKSNSRNNIRNALRLIHEKKI